MIEIIDLQGGYWTGWTFRNKKELNDFLQAQSCNISGYSDEEYYKVNAHVTLDDYCDLFEIEYKEVAQ